MGTSVDLASIASLTPVPESEADFWRTNVCDLLGQNRKAFPGAQPVSFARKHLRELATRDYFLVEKTDGLRCLLYLHQIGTEQGPAEAQFLIDRKNNYWYIQSGYLHLPPPSAPTKDGRGVQPPGYNNASWHLNTLLDGELVRQKYPDGREQLTYLIFDILGLDNESLLTRDYGQRIAKIDKNIVQPWKAFARDWPEDAKEQPFQMALKKPQMPYGVQMMFADVIPNLPHGNDGLIFTLKEGGYVMGTDEGILKWKPPHENTVDFMLRLGPFPTVRDAEGEWEDFDAMPKIELMVYVGRGGEQYKVHAELTLMEEEWEAMKGMQQMFDGRIMECWRDATTGRWRPKVEKDGTPRFRDDKEHANHVSVVESVIESIEDAVSEEDLVAHSARIRAAWKEREALEKEKLRAGNSAPPPPVQQQQHHQPQYQPQQQVRKVSQEDDGPGYVD